MRLFPALLVVTLVANVAHAGGRGDVAHKPDARPLQLLRAQPATKGTILMFHGFSSGPQHWAEEARLRYDEGYDVVVAALPGHGFVTKDGKEDVSRVPTATESDHYVKFAQAMFDVARRRSDKVHVVGFSVGGAHALEVAIRQREVRAKDGSRVLRSMVAINPYIGPTPSKVGPFHVDLDRVTEVADTLTFGAVAKRLAKKPYVFSSAQRHQLAGGHDVGFTTVTYGNVLGIGRFGDEVRRRANAAGALDLPAYVVLSEKDPTANPKRGAAVAERVGATTVVLPLSVHDPMSPETNPDAVTRQRVRDVISAALHAGR